MPRGLAGAPPEAPPVDLVCVVWNESRADLERYGRALARAWAALPAARRGRAVLLDNGSRQGSGEEARRILEDALGSAPTTIRLARNVGPTQARNLAFRETTAPYVAAFDSDGAPELDVLRRLAEALDRHPDAALAAARVVPFDAEPESSQEEAIELEWGPAGATVYRRQAFRELGGFDELFTWMCEDMDFGFRARAAGWKCLCVPATLFRHEVAHRVSAARTLRFIEYLMVWRHIHHSRLVTIKSWLRQVPALVQLGREAGWRAAAGGLLGLLAYFRHIPACERRRP